jgi:hypothetical protein
MQHSKSWRNTVRVLHQFSYQGIEKSHPGTLVGLVDITSIEVSHRWVAICISAEV